MITYRKISKDNRMYTSTERTELPDGYMMSQIDLIHNRLFPKYIVYLTQSVVSFFFFFPLLFLNPFF